MERRCWRSAVAEPWESQVADGEEHQEGDGRCEGTEAKQFCWRPHQKSKWLELRRGLCWGWGTVEHARWGSAGPLKLQPRASLEQRVKLLTLLKDPSGWWAWGSDQKAVGEVAALLGGGCRPSGVGAGEAVCWRRGGEGSSGKLELTWAEKEDADSSVRGRGLGVG